MKFNIYNIDDFKELNYYSKNNIRFYSLFLYILIIIIFVFILFIMITSVDNVVNGYGVIQTKILPVKIINETTGTIIESNLEQNKFISKGTLLYKLDSSLFEKKQKYFEIKKNELLEALDYLILNSDIKINNNFYTENIDVLEVLSVKSKYLLKIDKITIDIKEVEKNIYILSELFKIGGVSNTEYDASLNRLNILKSTVDEILIEYNEYITKKIKNIKQEIYNIELQIEELKTTIKKRAIYSPIDGYIELDRNINKFEILLEGTQIGTIISGIKNYYIEFFISEKDILKIKENMPIKYNLKVDNFLYNKVKFYGNVIRISHDSIDIKGERFYLVLGDIHSNNTRDISILKKGMTVDIGIITGKKKIIVFLLELLSLKNK